MQESQSKIQKRIDYLRQVDIFQFGSTINESSHLYEINLKDDTEDYDYQPFTTTYFSTEPPTSYDEEPSRWLPKQDDSPRLETEDHGDHNLSEFLKRVNEALETCEKAYNDYVMTEEKNTEQELFNKLHEILKPNYGKANKTRVVEPNSFLPHNDYVRRSNEFLQGDYDVQITDDSICENELESLIREYMSSEDMNEQARACGNGNGFYNSTRLEEQFTGASLEYWGDHSINSVEHSLIQSEWNILNPQSEFVSWL